MVVQGEVLEAVIFWPLVHCTFGHVLEEKLQGAM